MRVLPSYEHCGRSVKPTPQPRLSKSYRAKASHSSPEAIGNAKRKIVPPAGPVFYERSERTSRREVRRELPGRNLPLTADRAFGKRRGRCAVFSIIATDCHLRPFFGHIAGCFRVTKAP